jgi:hypothetical protein
LLTRALPLRRISCISILLVITFAFLPLAHAQSPSIELHLIDGDSGNPVEGAIVIDYWSKRAPLGLDEIACASGALLGIPVHCGGKPPIVVTVIEAQTDANGRAVLPDPEQRGWEAKREDAQWLELGIFKNGYRTEYFRRNGLYDRKKSSCVSGADRVQGKASAQVFIFPLTSDCRAASYHSPVQNVQADNRSEDERRWDSARYFASLIDQIVEHAEDRQAVLLQLRRSIETADAVLREPPPTRQGVG